MDTETNNKLSEEDIEIYCKYMDNRLTYTESFLKFCIELDDPDCNIDMYVTVIKTPCGYKSGITFADKAHNAKYINSLRNEEYLGKEVGFVQRTYTDLREVMKMLCDVPKLKFHKLSCGMFFSNRNPTDPDIRFETIFRKICNYSTGECCICLDPTIRRLTCRTYMCVQCHLSMKSNKCPHCRVDHLDRFTSNIQHGPSGVDLGVVTADGQIIYGITGATGMTGYTGMTGPPDSSPHMDSNLNNDDGV
jgi:hypothetical protein